jgi:hypothetical protein
MNIEKKLEYLTKIQDDLSVNFRDDKDVLEDIFDEVTSIASDITHNKNIDSLFPYIKKAVKAEYIARGVEGISARTEGSMSSQFEDIIEKMANNLIIGRKRRLS